MAQVSEGESRSTRPLRETVAIYLVIIALALVAGFYISKALIPTPKIGIIELQTQVNDLVAEILSREINYAIKTRDIKGVVLLVNSPGGSASAGHDIYYQVRKLRQEKPVVASVDLLAASAAYQIGIGTNEIYAKPASFIGSIGVIAGLPSPETLSEQFITTGPFKAIAFSANSQVENLEFLLAEFTNSVIMERSDAPNPLNISPDKLSTGEIWIGLEAKEFGLIDEFGSNLDAIDRAAELAGLKNYEVVNVRDEYLASLEEAGALASAQEFYDNLDVQAEIDLTTQEAKWPTFYQLYIPLE